MSDFIFRTEEMTNEQIQEFYVENTGIHFKQS